MADYDFKALSFWEFEQISRDLLRNALNIDFESFKSGKDQGIDLRHASDNKGEIIAQCKHYANSTYSDLKNTIKKEKVKIDKLKPNRYILITSLGLTTKNKEEIKSILGKHLIYTKDIVTRETLNGWLVDFPKIERSYIKLWATTGVALNQIIKSRIFNYSLSQIEELETKIKYFVKNQSFDESIKILQAQKFCIIAGIPGIGKTTLAEMLLVDFLRRDFEPIVITSDIEDAFDVFDKDAKRIYYYDDFLGQTGLEQKLNKNEDARIVEFCKLCRKTKNSYFILTTREYILNQAKATYEKLEKSGIDKRKCVIDLKSYSDLEKSKVLYNHIYHRKLPDKYKKALLKDHGYLKIIDHKSFNPRVIEWMVDSEMISDIPPEDYLDSFIYRLNNPSAIWSHAFNNQISDHARHLVMSLLTCSRFAYLSDCKKVFENLRHYLSNKYNFGMTANEFNTALKEVEGNFISVSLVNNQQIIHFHNPSIIDYVSYYLSENTEIVQDIISSFTHFDQFINLWNIFTNFEKNPLLHEDVKDIFMSCLAKHYGTDGINLTRYNNIIGKPIYAYSSSSIEIQVIIALNLELDNYNHSFIQNTKEIVDDYFTNMGIEVIWSRVKQLLIDLENKKEELQLNIDNYLIKSVNLLSENLTQINDYKQLADISKISNVTKDIIDEKIQMIEQDLIAGFEDEVEFHRNDNDVSELQDCLSDIEDIEIIFDFNLYEQKEYIETILNELGDPDEIYNDEYSNISTKSSTNTNTSEIIDIFNTLE